MKKMDLKGEGAGIGLDAEILAPSKRIIISLVVILGLIFSLLLVLFYVVPYYGFTGIHPGLPVVMGVLMAGIGGLVLTSLSMLVLVIVLGHDVPYSRKLRSFAVKFLLPVLIPIGRLLGLKREQVQHAFVAVNNELVLAHCRSGKPPKSLLLLMPHCLQDRDCQVKITYKVENCKRCGKCRIKDLIELSERYGANLAVATGGTIARRIVIETRPDLIIAVACERDLTSGIQDTTPLPVYGVFNQRPFGPCMNTQVAIEMVESVLKEVRALGRKKK